MEQEIELSRFWCPREDCRDYGKTRKDNIIIIGLTQLKFPGLNSMGILNMRL